MNAKPREYERQMNPGWAGDAAAGNVDTAG